MPHALTVSIFGGTAEYLALKSKDIGHESWFFWYVSACIVVSLLVYLWMPETRTTSCIDRDAAFDDAAASADVPIATSQG